MPMNVLCFNRKKTVRTNYNDKSIEEVRQENMRFIDLFAGIGGFRLGMEALGHECVGFVECDPFCEKCKKITKHIFSGERNLTICAECGKKKRQHARFSYDAIHNPGEEWTAYDIRDVTDNDLGILRGKGIDVICGGFPCQAFSVAGKRGGFNDTRGTLFFEIARFAQQIKPRFLFLENVKGLLSHDQGNTFGTILNTLDELGYDAEWQVLNSKNFGVPQNRERVFIIGHLRGFGRREVFPIGRTDQATDLPIEIIAHRDGYRRNTQVFSPDGITEALDTGQGGGRGHYVVEYDRKNGIGKELDIAHTLNSSDWRGLNRNQKQNAVAIPVLTPDRAEKRQNGRRFKEDGEPMFTITAQDKHGVMIKEATKQGYDIAYPGDSINYSVPNSETRRGRVGEGIANTLDTGCQQGVLTEEYRIRKLTPRECWRLQSFPNWAFDKAKEVNSDSQLYKQAGNSVTVNVIYEIAKRLGVEE
jgi:DNA (cytosine-5)-methyltransferase 1